jgi:hypothetical protein
MQIHLEPEAVQQVGVIDTRLEVIIVVPLIPEPLLGLQIDPMGQLFVDVGHWGKVGKVVGRRIAGGTPGRAVEEAQRVRGRPSDPCSVVPGRRVLRGDVVLRGQGQAGRYSKQKKHSRDRSRQPAQ